MGWGDALSSVLRANTLSSEASMKPQPKPDYSINLNDCIDDIADNMVYRTEFDDIPTDIYIPIVFRLINDVIDDISTSPEKYIKSKHQKLIEQAYQEYLAEN